jgi:carboxyl-terminal processing protease
LKAVWTAVLFGVAGLIAGFWLASGSVAVPGPLGWVQDLGEESLAEEVGGLVEEYYYRPVDPEQLDRASVEGMVDRLRRRYDDRFTHYFDPEQLERFTDSIEGTFSGVGMTVGDLSDEGLVIGRVFRGSPAEREGIERGDLITSVDGETVAGEGV